MSRTSCAFDVCASRLWLRCAQLLLDNLWGYAQVGGLTWKLIVATIRADQRLACVDELLIRFVISTMLVQFEVSRVLLALICHTVLKVPTLGGSTQRVVLFRVVRHLFTLSCTCLDLSERPHHQGFRERSLVGGCEWTVFLPSNRANRCLLVASLFC